MKNFARPLTAAALFATVALTACSAPTAGSAPSPSLLQTVPALRATPPRRRARAQHPELLEASPPPRRHAPPFPSRPPVPPCCRCPLPRARRRNWSRRRRSLAETAQRVPEALKADFARLNEVAVAGLTDQTRVFQRQVPGRHGPRDQMAGQQLFLVLVPSY